MSALSSPASTELQLQPQDAAPPFDGPFADMILRSCDGIRFHVSKYILSIASPVFADMFRLAVAAASLDEMCDGLPMVPMTEDAATLDLLLRWCYPTPRPPLATLEDVQRMVGAMQKYDIHAFDEVAQEALQMHLARDPSAMLSIAIKFRMCEWTRRAVLALPLATLMSHPGLADRTLLALIRYHTACGAAASAVTSRRDFFEDTFFTTEYGGPCCQYCSCLDHQGSSWSAPRFVWNFLDQADHALLLHPHRDAVISLCKIEECDRCRRAYEQQRDIEKLVQRLVREVNVAVEQVPVPDFWL
ncbi:hypothetical protein FA95DRAFT_1560156 [Auriscalpium vulgare]|uniref:Uncharacterized protein n=1 Tax=Auriscalpium vulgare TaxID=40419 RepID=A0ACB8RQL4_9AGAM|nr:hypothetical protein FA95DRAFT_1560156 [Auriscalpium vulgare]